MKKRRESSISEIGDRGTKRKRQHRKKRRSLNESSDVLRTQDKLKNGIDGTTLGTLNASHSSYSTLLHILKVQNSMIGKIVSSSESDDQDEENETHDSKYSNIGESSDVEQLPIDKSDEEGKLDHEDVDASGEEDQEAPINDEDWFNIQFSDASSEAIAEASVNMQAKKTSCRYYSSTALNKTALLQSTRSSLPLSACKHVSWTVPFADADFLALSRVEEMLLQNPSHSIPNSDLHVKGRLLEGWKKHHGSPLQLSPLQALLFSHLNTYKDLLYPFHAPPEISELLVFHALNHVFKTRDRIIKNTASLNSPRDDPTPLLLRDQGFTRPKVLFIVPFKSSAYQLVQMIKSLMPSVEFSNARRFDDTFGPTQDSAHLNNKPQDYVDLFEGNHDQDFLLGLKFTRKTARLFAPVYASDMIIASPLELRYHIVELEDSDFLASIEIVMTLDADVLLMQNWDHLKIVFQHMNLLPKQSHDCDFSRVRQWSLDQHASCVRQTILMSSFLFPELNSLAQKYCLNRQGLIKYHPTFPDDSHQSMLSRVHVKIQQIFHRVSGKDVLAAEEARFEALTKQILRAFKQQRASHVALFIPSSFDHPRIVNYLTEELKEFPDQALTWSNLDEFVDMDEMTRARTKFFQGRSRLLLYTERAHFHRRYRLKGVRHWIFYGLPEYAHFYPELLNSVDDQQDKEVSCTVLFSPYDMLKLERVVGTDRCKKMLTSSKSVFMFC